MDLNQRVQAQVAHAYAHAPAIRDLMMKAGVTPDDIQTVADLAKIPVTSKDKLQALQQENPPFGGFLAVPKERLARIFLSPGPIYDPQGLEDEELEIAAREAFAESGFGAGDIVLNTFMYHMVPAGLFLDGAMRLLGATVVPLGPGNTEVLIKVMLDLQANAYVGTPSFLEIIYGKAAEMGLTPQALPLKKAFFGAEPYTSAQRQRFEGEFGLTTAQTYASADLGVIAYEKPQQSGWFVPQNLIVQICDPQTGVPLEDGLAGEVVVTTFAKAYPLIRFGTGDLSMIEQGKLVGLLGRSGEAIKVRGMFLHPNALKAALTPFSNIKKFQAVVRREGASDTVTLKLILSEGEVDTAAVMQAVKSAARLSINAVEVVDKVDGLRTIKDERDLK
jgi:phenylacetate-CoA ligase